MVSQTARLSPLARLRTPLRDAVTPVLLVRELASLALVDALADLDLVSRVVPM